MQDLKKKEFIIRFSPFFLFLGPSKKVKQLPRVVTSAVYPEYGIEQLPQLATMCRTEVQGFPLAPIRQRAHTAAPTSGPGRNAT